MRNLRIIGAVVILASLFSFGCGSPAGEPPMPADELVKEGFTNLYKADSAKYEVTLAGNANGVEGATPASVSFDFSMSGVYDSADMKNPQYTIAVDGTLSTDEAPAESLDLELRMTDKTLFAMLNDVPTFGGAVPAEMVAGFANQWWSVPIPEGAFEKIDLFDEDVELTPEEQALKDLVDNANFFKNIEYLGNDSVKGEDAYHYSAELDKEGLKLFMQKASELQGEVITEADLAEFDKQFASTIMPSEVWISVDDIVLTRLVTTLSVDPPEGEGSLSLDIDAIFYDINEAVSVDVPADAKEFDPMLMMGGMPAPVME